MRKYICIAILCICMGMFTGCNTKELEDRSYPLAIGLDKVGDGCQAEFYFPKLSTVEEKNAKASGSENFYVNSDSYYEAWQTYEADKEYFLDYNHLKVLVLGMDFFEDQEMLSDFLEFSIKDENFSRNTLIFIASPQASDILELNDNLDIPIGTFLEEIETNSNIYKTRALPTLGDLYNAYYNRSELLYFPVLNENGDIPVIYEYYLMKDYEPIGILDEQTAFQGMLTLNKLREFSIKLDNGEVVKLDDPTCTYTITKEEDTPVLHITVKGEAVLVNRRIDSDEERREISLTTNAMLEKMLTQTFHGIQKEKGMDMTGSFVKLGGYNRDLYTEYVDKKEIYEKRVDIQVDSEVTIVQEYRT